MPLAFFPDDRRIPKGADAPLRRALKVVWKRHIDRILHERSKEGTGPCLYLGGIDDLASAIGVDFDDVHEVLDDFDRAPDYSLVSELTLWRADQTKKSRDVIAIKKRWRLIQERIYVKLLLPWFEPSKCCHGGVKRRSPATNARAHLHNTHAFVTDISSFFPSIGRRRVNKLFSREGLFV